MKKYMLYDLPFFSLLLSCSISLSAELQKWRGTHSTLLSSVYLIDPGFSQHVQSSIQKVCPEILGMHEKLSWIQDR